MPRHSTQNALNPLLQNDPLVGIINSMESSGRNPLANATPFVSGPQRILNAGGHIAQQALDTGVNALTLPRDVYQGRVDPLGGEATARTMDLADMVTLGGAGAALRRGGSFLGSGGGKLVTPSKSKKVKRRVEFDDELSRVEVADIGTNRLEISFDDVTNMNRKRSSFEVNFGVSEKVDLRNVAPDTHHFSSGGVTHFGSPSGRRALGLPPNKQAGRIIATVGDSVRDFVKLKKPQRIMFSAADGRLDRFYEVLGPKIAKQTKGKYRKEGDNHIISFFDRKGKPIVGASIGLTLGLKSLLSEDEQIKRGDLI